MQKLQVKIAEHYVSFATESERLLEHLKSRYPIVDGEGEPFVPDMTVEVHDRYGSPFVEFDVEAVATESGITYSRADYLVEATPDYACAKAYVYDDFALKHVMFNLYSAYVIHHEWGLLIHSSCLIDRERAHLFAGRSGAGKSTVARLSEPRTILSDEATIVKLSGGPCVAYNSPFRSDTEMPRLPDRCPLSSIQLLQQADHVASVKMNKADALSALPNFVFYWAHSPEETKKALRLTMRLADVVPVYQLAFPKNDTFWEAIS